MLENRVNPIRFFGMLILAVPVLLFGILFQEFRVRDIQLENMLAWHVQVILVMFFGLFTSLSLFFKWKYSRLLTNILLVFILILFSFFIYEEVQDFSERDIGSLIISLFVYLSILFCFLFINNKYMQVYYQSDFILKEDDDDVLDSF